jgi:tetratricopeptide (TPR) repeat protein
LPATSVDPLSGALIDLGPELETSLRRELGWLRGAITDETVVALAGARSPDPGLLVLTSERLIFAFTQRKRLQQQLRWVSYPLSTLRGSRSDSAGLLVLRDGQSRVRFSQLRPAGVEQRLGIALGPTELDRYISNVQASEYLTRFSDQFRDAFSAAVPPGERLAIAFSSGDTSIVGLTGNSAVATEFIPERKTIRWGHWRFDDPSTKGITNLSANTQDAVLALLESQGAWDQLLVLAPQSGVSDATLSKARALAAKGLPDAALITYDDAIKQGRQTDVAMEWFARYSKADLLIKLGQTGQARRELARLYADCPRFPDDLALLEKLKPSDERIGGDERRRSTPQNVRHAVWRRDEGRCVQCGSHEDLEFDHIIPVSKGGANTERNLQLLCESCNRGKGATI